jgi:multidrug resistance efflux pump
LTTLVSECEQSIKSLQVTNAADLSIISDAPLRGAIAVQEANLRLAEAELQPIVLTSPITGSVSKIDKLEGSTVGANDPIVTVASPKVDYILGYVGQPLRIEPVLGMKVEVRSRGLNRTVTYARITHIGSQIELFNAPLRARGMGNAQERGLPIAVSVPADLKLRPGELVDITLASKND